MAVRKGKTRPTRTLQQPLQPRSTPPVVQPPPATTPSPTAADARRAARFVEQTRQQAEDCAKLVTLPVQQLYMWSALPFALGAIVCFTIYRLTKARLRTAAP